MEIVGWVASGGPKRVHIVHVSPQVGHRIMASLGLCTPGDTPYVRVGSRLRA